MAALATARFAPQPQITPEAALLKAITGYWLSKAIYVAAELNIADRLKGRAKTVAELAVETHTHAVPLYRVLRSLSGAGIFAEDTHGRFTLTPMSEPLRTGPGSLRATALHLLETPTWVAWDDLLESVRTGDAAFPRVNALDTFSYYAEHRESAKPFHQAAIESCRTVSRAVTAAYDFSRFRRIVDLGGGHGGLLQAVLGTARGAKGILFDRPDVVEAARAEFRAGRFAGQCRFAGGNFFDSVPEGDAYLLQFILHEWNDDRAGAILRNVYRSIEDGGRLLIIESVVPDGNGPHFSKGMDVHRLVMGGGHERTTAEYWDLLTESGFRMRRVIATESPVSIIEAEKAEIR